MSLRSPLCALFLAATLGSCGGRPAPREGQRRPDVLLFVVDTLRKDRLSCYGYPRETSPHLDRLALEGALFEDPVAQCSWTKPSMVSLFGGRYVTEYRDLPFEDTPTLAETLRAAGYRTLGVVGNVLLSEDGDFDRGFEHYDARHNEHPDRERGELGRPLQDLARDLWPELERALEPGEDGERPPLFVYVHAMDPHNPYLPHARFDELLPIDGAQELGGWQRHRFHAGGAPPTDEDPGWRRSWKRMQIARGRYDQEVRHTDEVLRGMLDRMGELGLLEHAVFALVADHGEVLYDHETYRPPERMAEAPPHEYFHKEHGTFLYQSLIGTPFVLWGAGVPAGLRIAQPVENVDLVPTLLELARVPAPEGLDGRSLLPLLRGEPVAPPEHVFSFVMQNTCVREVASGLKLVLPTEIGARAGMRPELYDLHSDPLERVDLAAERPEEVARLTAVIEAWRARHPTPSSLGRELAPQERADLMGLGYLGEEEDGAGKAAGD